MVFVVDDFAAWLLGLLADAGRKKLTTLVLGDAQQRALRQAAIIAVQDTAGELSPADGQRAWQIAMVISEVFRVQGPDAPLTGAATLVEGLQAGIAGQLAVLDDPGLTGTGQSSAAVLGVPGTVLADRLTGHLMREIMLRGSRGGPLTPLAGQLNHDLTHLQVQRVEAQGQRVEGILARLADEARDALARPGGGAAAGRPLDKVTAPFALEVHRPVQPEDPQPGLPVLPPYVPREHDTTLGSVVRAAAEGSSGIAVLVGGSSTGKTRACWEALQLLRDRPEKWRLWHPIDPSRPDAALRELPAIGPRTVVWLNEAQFYLHVADGGLGERVAAGLRELLRDPARAPVLVLATLWPQFWDGLTARPAGGAPDPHAQARELLDGHDITVPAAFTTAQLQRLSQAGDTLLAQAAAGAQDGQVIQFLAGVPELLSRYRNAPPATTALIHAAMDARRLGMGIAMPHAFLEAATPGYLTDTEWDALGEDWLEQALAYTAVPCKGVRGPLTRIRPRPASSGVGGPGASDGSEQLAGGQVSIAGAPLYRLADYLDQHGRQHRKGQIPPAGFWAAAADHAFPGDQAALGDAAHLRGLCRDAAQLHKNAAARGNFSAVFYLSNPHHCLRDDVGPVRWALAYVPLDDPGAVAALLDRLRRVGAEELVTELLRRDPVAHASLWDPRAVAALLDGLRRVGAEELVTELLRRDPVAHTSLWDRRAVAALLDGLRVIGAEEQVTKLADRATAQVPLDDPRAVADLLDGLQWVASGGPVAALLRRDPAAHVSLRDRAAVGWLLSGFHWIGARDQVTVLADRMAARACLDDPHTVAVLLLDLRGVGAEEQLTALLRRDPAAHISLDDLQATAMLLSGLRCAGAEEQVTVLADRAAAHAPLDDPRAVAELLEGLRRANAEGQVEALLRRDPAARVCLDDPGAVAELLDGLRRANAEGQVEALLRRDPAARVCLDDPGAVAELLDGLRRANAEGQVEALLRRDPAARVCLDDPGAVTSLLVKLWEAGANEQVTALAHRAATRMPLDDPHAVAELLESMPWAGAGKQAATLVARLPEAGMFDLFCHHQDRPDRFRFGREPDGAPARPWGWGDLD